MENQKPPLTAKQAIVISLFALIAGTLFVILLNLFYSVPLKIMLPWYALVEFVSVGLPWACLTRETKRRSIRAHNCFVVFTVIIILTVIIAQWKTENEPFPMWAIVLLVLGGCVAYSVMVYCAVLNFIRWRKGALPC